MIEEKNTEAIAMYEEKAIPLTEPVLEKQTKTAKHKRNRNSRLTKCYEQQEKLLKQKNTVNKKVEAIDKCISENDAIIAELENKELFKICKKKGVTIQELIGFLKEMPEGITLEYVANAAFMQTPANPEQFHL